MAKKTKKLNNLLLAFILVILSLFSAVLGFTPNVAYAEELGSNVLTDLQKDETFSVTDYQLVEDDYSLQVIQIAESTDKQLLVYVYNPSGNMQATTINLSTAINDSFFPLLYNLTLQSKEGTLSKYVVNDLEVKNDVVRYYDIVSIFRPWDESVDEKPTGDNTISEVSYEVGRLYTACTLNNKVYYSWTDVETIDITDKFVGFVRYDDGYIGSPGMGYVWYSPGHDSHFVAFSTDKQIDRLYEADVYYKTQKYSYYKQQILGATTIENENFSEPKDAEPAKIKYTDRVEVETDRGFHYYSHTFNRIQTVNEFMKTEDFTHVFNMGLFSIKEHTRLTDAAKKELESKQWVLRFIETEYTNKLTGDFSVNETSKGHTIVGDVSILRLKFETDGKVYNLGVVDNKQTGSDKPSNETDVTITSIFEDIWNWIKTHVVAACMIFFFGTIGLILFIIFFKPIMKFIGKVIKKIFKGLWYIITLPWQIMKK